MSEGPMSDATPRGLCGEFYHVFLDGNERCECGEKYRPELDIPQAKTSKKKWLREFNFLEKLPKKLRQGYLKLLSLLTNTQNA